MKKYIFKTHGTDIPGGVDIDFIFIKASDTDSATAIVKSILRKKRKTSKGGYRIIRHICLDDIKDDVKYIDGVFYQY